MSTAQTSTDVLVRLQAVGRTFRTGELSVEVLRGISMDVRAGEILALVGPSGSGKSTLLNIIGGIDQPSVGQVWYRDQELTHASSAQLTRYRREIIGFVFQFYNLVPTLTARENVMAAIEIADDPLDADDVLDQLGLHDRAHHFPSQLSGGEQQRVSIARALAKNPDLLLCDEPTGALDFETGKKILRLLVDLKCQYGKSILIITHNTAIAHMADRVAFLRSGQITELRQQSTPREPEAITW